MSELRRVSAIRVWPQEYKLAYGAHQVFLRLGFQAADLFTGVTAGRVVLLLSPNPSDSARRFTFTVCPTTMHEGQFIDGWDDFVIAVNNLDGISERQRDRWVQDVLAQLDKAGLVIALRAKGMLPAQLYPASSQPGQ